MPQVGTGQTNDQEVSIVPGKWHLVVVVCTQETKTSSLSSFYVARDGDGLRSTGAAAVKGAARFFEASGTIGAVGLLGGGGQGFISSLHAWGVALDGPELAQLFAAGGTRHQGMDPTVLGNKRRERAMFLLARFGLEPADEVGGASLTAEDETGDLDLWRPAAALAAAGAPPWDGRADFRGVGLTDSECRFLLRCAAKVPGLRALSLSDNPAVRLGGSVQLLSLLEEPPPLLQALKLQNLDFRVSVAPAPAGTAGVEPACVEPASGDASGGGVADESWYEAAMLEASADARRCYGMKIDARGSVGLSAQALDTLANDAPEAAAAAKEFAELVWLPPIFSWAK